ncbi:hypothetical protein [Helicobacter sp. 11S02596-1]|uniref:hypothetical protein n=1 Tax=Helicobacter sp. 11S02596-1 TaxID=1476194 RepID=UPI000BA57FF8|nr:hypothetical protein [Helicobacter sp. 11S02596-1]PAF42830.1 hypothetical protein BJI48_06140 [Helicobacter sp. 11S02596-1]
MAISPIGNVTYINQNSQAPAVQQANALNRSDLTNIINKEFEDKIKDIQEVRPTEDTQAIHPDGKGNGGFEQSEDSRDESKKSLTDKSSEEEPAPASLHILDIKV